MKINCIKLSIILMLFSSCGNSSDDKKVTIDDFSEKFVDSLIPIPDKNYSVFYTKIKGHSNDTIHLNISSGDNRVHDYYFTGDFEQEIRLDYYGESKQYVTFDPYKATNGKVRLEYRL